MVGEYVQGGPKKVYYDHEGCNPSKLTGMIPEMKLRLGQSLPMVGLGLWKQSGSDVKPLIAHAIKTGYRLFDTAAVYENEPELGEAFSAVFSDPQYNVTRKDVHFCVNQLSL